MTDNQTFTKLSFNGLSFGYSLEACTTPVNLTLPLAGRRTQLGLPLFE